MLSLASALAWGAPVTGAAAPDFRLNDMSTGNPVTLSGLKGQVVVLQFWASWCPHSRSSLPHLQQIATGNPKVTVLSIDDEDAVDVKDFMKSSNYTFRVLLDPGHSAYRAYNITGLPTLVVIDRAGNIGGVFPGAPPSQVDSAIKTALAVPGPAAPTPSAPATVTPRPSSPASTGGSSAVPPPVEVSPVGPPPANCVMLDAGAAWRNGTVYVKAKGTFQPMGAFLAWDAGKRTLTITAPNKRLVLTAGRRTAILNGKTVDAGVPALRVSGNDQIVPLRFVAQSLGYKVEYTCTQCGVYIRSDDHCGFVTF